MLYFHANTLVYFAKNSMRSHLAHLFFIAPIFHMSNLSFARTSPKPGKKKLIDPTFKIVIATIMHLIYIKEKAVGREVVMIRDEAAFMWL